MHSPLRGQIEISGGLVCQSDRRLYQRVRRSRESKDAAPVNHIGVHVQHHGRRPAQHVRESIRLLVATRGNVWNCNQGHVFSPSSDSSFKGGTVWEMTDYGYSVEVAEGYEEAILRTRLALKSEGFSILTEMHVGGLLGPEAGTDRQYLFMGAWSPATTQAELTPGMQVAVHLPCNVVVQESGASALVAALDPTEDLESPNSVSPELADEARGALARVLQKATVTLS